MTKAEFREREAMVKERVRRCQIVPWNFFLPVYLAMILAIPALIACEVWLVMYGGPDVERVQILIAIVFCVGLAFVMQYQLRKARRVGKAGVNELGLLCPSCRKSLYRRMEGGEGKCPHCGVGVFSDS